MKKMSRKAGIITSSIATIAICSSLVVGSTYALFTSEDSVNIAVTSAKLDVTAEIANVTTTSTLTDKEGNASVNAQLSAVKEGKTLNVSNMVPGDVVNFEVNITRNTTVDIQYRLSFGCTEEDNKLFSQLLLGVADKKEQNQADYTYYISNDSGWEKKDTTNGAPVTETKLVSLELPAYVGNDYKNLECEITFAVEAVQGNAVQTGEASAVVAHRVTDETGLNAAIEDIKNTGNGAIVLDGDNTSWVEKTVNLDFSQSEVDVTELVINGYKVGTLNINAPKANVNYYNEYTNAINVIAVSNTSIHVYGEVADTLTVQQGHAVVEKGADVAKAVVTPVAGAEASITANEKLNNLKVEGEGTASVNIADAVVISEMVVTNTNPESNIKNEGIVEKVQSTEGAVVVKSEVKDEATFISAVKVGGVVELSGDVTITQLLDVTNDVTINLNGYTLTIDVESGRPFNVTAEDVTLSFTNGNIVIPGEENAKAYGIININASRCELLLSGVNIDGCTDEGALIKANNYADGVTDCNITLDNVTARTNYLVVNILMSKGNFTVNGGTYTLLDKNIGYIDNYTDPNVRKKHLSSYYAGFNVGMSTGTVGDVYGVFNEVNVIADSRSTCSANESVVEFNNCTIGDPQNNDYSGYLATAVSVCANGRVIVNGGTYSGKQALYVWSSGGTITVNENTVLNGDIQLDLTKEDAAKGRVCSIVLNKGVTWNGTTVKCGGTAQEVCEFTAHVSTAEELIKMIAANSNLTNYTVVLDNDITVQTMVKFTKDVQIDLNNKKLTIVTEQQNICAMGGDAVISNGNLDLQLTIADPTQKSALWLYSSDVALSNVNLTTNGMVKLNNTSVATKLDVNGGSLNATLLYVQKNGTANINGCDINLTGQLYVGISSTVSIDNSDININSNFTNAISVHGDLQIANTQMDITINNVNNASIAIGDETKVCNVIFDNINYKTNGCGVAVFNTSKVEINDSTIVSTNNSAVSSNASAQQKTQLEITGSKLIGFACGLLFNVGESLTVTNTQVYGINQAVFVRVGNAVFTGCTLQNNLQYNTAEDAELGTTQKCTDNAGADTFNAYFTGDWGTGSQNIPLNTVVVGSKNGGYENYATCKFVDTTIVDGFVGNKDEALRHYLVYSINDTSKEGTTANVTYDAATAQKSGINETTVLAEREATITQAD